MSITSSLNLAIVSTDGSASLSKSVTGLSFIGINEMYIQPQVIGVNPPLQPVCTPTTGGSMAAGNYLVKITYVNAPQGESLPSPESASATVAASGKLTVASPAASSPATGYNVYITAAGGSTNTETKQNTNPIPIGTNYVQSAAVSAGAALPGSNSTLTYSVPLPQTPAQLVYLRNLAPAGLATPAAPTLSQIAGGALSGRTYYVRIAYVNSLGETLGSIETSLVLSANFLLVVSSPPPLGSATGWNVYVSSSTGTETKQNTSVLAIGLSFTEPTSGLIGGAALPSTNTTASIATLSWTPQGGSSNPVLDLVPQAAIALLEPTSVGGFMAGTGLGGITAVSVAVSNVQTSIEAFFAG
jgi:hypothetical protein